MHMVSRDIGWYSNRPLLGHATGLTQQAVAGGSDTGPAWSRSKLTDWVQSYPVHCSNPNSQEWTVITKLWDIERNQFQQWQVGPGLHLVISHVTGTERESGSSTWTQVRPADRILLFVIPSKSYWKGGTCLFVYRNMALNFLRIDSEFHYDVETTFISTAVYIVRKI